MSKTVLYLDNSLLMTVFNNWQWIWIHPNCHNEPEMTEEVMNSFNQIHVHHVHIKPSLDLFLSIRLTLGVGAHELSSCSVTFALHFPPPWEQSVSGRWLVSRLSVASSCLSLDRKSGKVLPGDVLQCKSRFWPNVLISSDCLTPTWEL